MTRTIDTEASRDEFHILLARARRVTELPGEEGRPLAYRSAGARVLAECNVLLGHLRRAVLCGAGGTPAMVNLARHGGKPLICIDAVAPHAIHLNQAAEPLAAILDLARRLVQTLA